MSAPTKTPWSKACAGVQLAPVKMSESKNTPAPQAASAGGKSYVPPSLRNKAAAAGGAFEEPTVNLNDSRAFPTMGAPGRPTPVKDAGKSGTAFKQAALDCLAKEAEAEATAALAPEEDPLKMSDAELGLAGWTVLTVNKDAPTFNERLRQRELVAEAANSDEHFLGVEGRDKFYDDVMNNPKPTLYEQLYGVRAFYDPVNNTYGPPKDVRIHIGPVREGPSKSEIALQRFRPRRTAPVLSV